MAVPSYATDLNDIFLDGGTTWTLVGGGRQTNTETDDFIQGSSCWSHDPFSSGEEGGVMNSAETVAADDAIFYWVKCDVVATLATHASGGMQVLVGNSATALKSYYVRGSDDYEYGGWVCIPVDPTKTQSASIGTPTATTDWFGARWNVPGSGASKGYPMKVDAMRHGRQIEVTAGEVANPATWDALAGYDADTTRMWGICQPTNTGAALQGLLYWGTGAASVYSRDSNRSIVIIDTEWTNTDFTQILFAHASNDIVWDNVGLIALGTNNRGIIDVTANGAVTWTNSVFQGIDITNLLAGSTFDGSKWLGTNAVTAPGSSLLGSSFLEPTVAADTAVLVWDTATDTDGLLDGAEFVSHDTTAHHAIEFTTFATSFDLVGLDFTGFGAEAANDAALYFPDTGSDRAWVVNLIGCTGTINFKKVRAGDTVSLVIDPVTLTVTVEGSGAALSGARVMAEVTSAAGGWPYQESVTSITQSAGTATATHTAHGLSTNDWVIISGVTNGELYNGVHQITVTGVNTYTFSVDSGLTSPATGTITATFVVMQGTTNGSGVITATYSYTADQPVRLRTRSASGSPYYKADVRAVTIDSASGANQTVALILDE